MKKFNVFLTARKTIMEFIVFKKNREQPFQGGYSGDTDHLFR